MRPHLLKLGSSVNTSFHVRRDYIPLNTKWHYHGELELLYIRKGRGTYLIGDSIKPLKENSVFLIGSNLPHYLKFDESGTGETIDVIVAHFTEDFLGKKFLDLPEVQSIRQLLENGAGGLEFECKSPAATMKRFEALLHSIGLKKITAFLDLLAHISTCRLKGPLSSVGYKPDSLNPNSERINDIYEYTIKNFHNRIELKEIATIANISPNSFCRYFKSRTGKTYSRFLEEIRIGHICKQLIETNKPIKMLCYEGGFNNFTSFHKSFKQITGMSPLVYQKRYKAS